MSAPVRWLFAALLAVPVLSACQKTVEFNPRDSDAFRGRSVVVLESTPILPLPQAILDDAQARFEAALAESRDLGEVTTRATMIEAGRKNAVLGANYLALSDIATVLGFIEREISGSVTQAAPADLFASIQALDLACPQCEQDDRVAVVAQIFDARTAELLWRLHIARDVNRGASPDELTAHSVEITTELLESLDFLLKPKWHRQRFDGLRRRPADTPAGSDSKG